MEKIEQIREDGVKETRMEAAIIALLKAEGFTEKEAKEQYEKKDIA